MSFEASVCTRLGNGTPLQYSCLENPMDRGAWWAAVHGVVKSRTWLSNFTFPFHFHALEEEMATHSSVLALRLPGTGEPGGLPSMGSHRVRHDWSDLAAAAAGFLSRIEKVVMNVLHVVLAIMHLEKWRTFPQLLELIPEDSPQLSALILCLIQMKRAALPKGASPVTLAGTGSKDLAPLSQFETTLKGHPSFRVPCEVGGSICWDGSAAQLLSLPSPASLPCLPFQWWWSPKFSLMNFSWANVHLRVCLPGHL